MNRRRTVLNYHPIQNGICSPMINDYGFTVSVGASGGRRDRPAPDRAAHPSVSRTSSTWSRIWAASSRCYSSASTIRPPRQHPNLPERPSVTARRFYYDIVGHGSQPDSLRLEGVRADHLVAGSDYPFCSRSRPTVRTFLSSRIDAAAGGRGQDPAPQRPDRPGAAALGARRTHAGLATRDRRGTSRASAAPRSRTGCRAGVARGIEQRVDLRRREPGAHVRISASRLAERA